MNRFTLGLLAALALVSAPALAQSECSPSGSNQDKPSADGDQVQGKVTHVSSPMYRSDGELLVLDPATRHVVVVKVNKASKIWLNGHHVGLNKVPEGAVVRVSYDLRGDNMIAQRIEVYPGSVIPTAAASPVGGSPAAPLPSPNQIQLPPPPSAGPQQR